jgi:hypothetical protein
LKDSSKLGVWRGKGMGIDLFLGSRIYGLGKEKFCAAGGLGPEVQFARKDIFPKSMKNYQGYFPPIERLAALLFW